MHATALPVLLWYTGSSEMRMISVRAHSLMKEVIKLLHPDSPKYTYAKDPTWIQQRYRIFKRLPKLLSIVHIYGIHRSRAVRFPHSQNNQLTTRVRLSFLFSFLKKGRFRSLLRFISALVQRLKCSLGYFVSMAGRQTYLKEQS